MTTPNNSVHVVKRKDSLSQMTPSKAVSPLVPVAPVAPAAPQVNVKPPVRKARRSPMFLVSFLLCFAIPLALCATYLWGYAADRYQTGFSFSVRSETATPPGGEAMAAMMGGGGGAASDAGVVADFIISREMVTRLMDKGVDLPTMFSLHADTDPVFSLRDTTSVEAITDYWQSAVTAERDTQTGIVRVSMTAFTPEDAMTIAQAALSESQALVDDLSAQAKADMIRSSQAEVDRAQDERNEVRAELSDFRVENAIVDPETSLAGRTRILDELRSELDKALIARADIAANARPNDIRVQQADVRIQNIQDLIDTRSQEFGDEQGYARIASQYEDLVSQVEFSEITLRNAITVLDAARKEADMRGAYLTSHVMPHTPQSSEVPARINALLMIGSLLLAIWIVISLIHTAIRERFL